MISKCHQFCRSDKSLERDRWCSRSRTVREIAHDFETFSFANYCKSFRIPKLSVETVTRAETFQFQLFLIELYKY
jgi:hypothetical protein